MPAAPPDFTIIMPTRNHARWIEAAVRSVLEQDFRGRVELVVFDALSDDATPQILERYRDRLTWRREADAGQVDAINRGLREARGEIVAWLNSDDLYLPGALARVHAAFAADSALDFVYGDVLEIAEDGRIMTPNPFTEDCDAARYFYSHNYICQPTVFVRRRVIERVGLLRPDLRWLMDYEWFTRFFRTGLRGLRLRHFLAANRDHPATKTNSGGLARWWETIAVRAAIPGPMMVARRSTWIYSLEYVIKALNAAGWAAPAARPVDQRNFRQRLVDRLNARLVRLVQARSFDDIVRRYGRDIAPHGANVADLWSPSVARAFQPVPVSAPSAPDSRLSPPDTPLPTPSPMPAITPLEPVLAQAYPHLVIEMHDALRALLFPKLLGAKGRLPLLAKLIGTGIGEAMYLLDALHASLADAGDICEFGVAQGATSALLANEIRHTNKRLWLYDSFAGLPKPSAQDQLKDDIFNLGSIERYEGEMRCDSAEVEFRLAQIGFPKDRYVVRAGWVHETLRDDNGPAAVSCAYVDFDFYEPILHTLDYLDRHLTTNGRIVVDDYDHFSTGAKTAVDEFVRKTGGRFELIKPLPFAGAFCILHRTP
ncbi:MAG TPA: glycosyltransferase [Opitutus sp.]|nr:glycosyltransferase [Opitutus sp.]